jgi:eukaryotic-like serine/threonine-protein kinase
VGTPAATAPEENRTPSARELMLDAAVAVRRAKNSAAIPLLERVVREQPNHAVAQFFLAYCKEQLGRHDQALERYEVAQSLLPNDVRPTYQRGMILGMRNKHAEAEKEFSQVIELDRGHMLAHRNRGFARIRLERYEEAEQDLTDALRLGGAPIQIHTYRSLARLKRGDKAGAAVDKAAADALTPTHEADFISRGQARLKADDYRAALADFHSAERLNARSFPAIVNQLHILADKLHEPEAALAVATRLTRQYPEYGTGRIDRAVILARLGKRADAHAEAQLALNLSKDPDVTYRAACVYALTSRIVEADQVKALGLLEQAMKDGYRKEAMIRSDPDLDAIRDHERFQKIADAAASLFR